MLSFGSCGMLSAQILLPDGESFGNSRGKVAAQIAADAENWLS